MANYVKNPTWVDGSGGATPINAAKLNILENGIYDAHFQPAARAFNVGGQTIAHATWTSLALSSERFDTDAIHDTVTNNSRLTCKTGGVYSIFGHVVFTANSTGVRYIRLFLNGATVIASQVAAFTPGGVDNTALSIATVYQLAVNDYVELQAYQTSGVGLSVLQSPNDSPELGMARVA